ncbi:MAG: dTDP-glucose 4,6-dehydratase [Nitrospinae bacterium]|nr:dTDP-glucose 4,6-dehydratase [Nitrospinota bacterium]
MKTVLVTGGAGFIGGNFSIALTPGGQYRVVNLDALTYAGHLETLKPLEKNPNHIFIHGDIRDRALVKTLLTEHAPDHIVNFAAESHVDRSIDSPGDFISTNVNGMFELLEAVRGYYSTLSGAKRDGFKFVHVSTDEVYGSLGPGDERFTEKTPYAPNSPYAASKAASDHLARAYHHTYGLPVNITNCSNNYGPYQFPEKLIPLLISKARRGEPMPVYGDGQNVRDWLYVKDHCEAIRLVMEKGRAGETYNIGGGAEMKNMDVVKMICAIMDELFPQSPHRPHEKLITFVQDRPGHDRRYAINAGKIEKELGWRPSETFPAGLRKTVQWYLDNEEWVAAVTRETYKGERLGVSGK